MLFIQIDMSCIFSLYLPPESHIMRAGTLGKRGQRENNRINLQTTCKMII